MRTYLIDGKEIKYPTSNKELKRYLLSINVWANTVKWLGRYDIAFNGKLYPTGLRSIQDLTFEQWGRMIKHIEANPEDTGQLINGCYSWN